MTHFDSLSVCFNRLQTDGYGKLLTIEFKFNPSRC